MASVYDFAATTIDGQVKSLSDYAGRVMVIVNVASKCGFTSQYEGLETLYQDYKDDGFVILGFPCNQFGAQEPGDEAEIASFCSTTYNVSFPMFAKVDVNGTNAHPLYKHIKKARPGIAGSAMIKWNFTKFLIDKEGMVMRRYWPQDRPAMMKRKIEGLLSA